METESMFAAMKLTPRAALRELSLHGWNPKTFGATLGFCGGVIAPVFGAVLTAISWLTGTVWHGWHLQRDGTILFFLTIPFLILGAHCLDLIDKQDHSRRVPLSTFNNPSGAEKDNDNDLSRDQERS
jgi:hypothetical protein